MKTWKLALTAVAFLSATLMLSAGGGDTAKNLVGVWQLSKGEGLPAGAVATVEFTKDGKMKMQIKLGDKSKKFEGTYSVKDMTIESKMDFGGQTKQDTSKIKKLTEKELVVQDQKGKVEEYRRVK